MGILQKLKKLFIGEELRIVDPIFGKLLFVYIARAPEKSYWECEEWKFPNTGDVISIGLPGDESGPLPQSRDFFLELPSRFEKIISKVRPPLSEVFKKWLDQDLPENIFTEVKLVEFSLNENSPDLPNWEIMFETTGSKWLGISIPFIGDIPQIASVDT